MENYELKPKYLFPELSGKVPETHILRILLKARRALMDKNLKKRGLGIGREGKTFPYFTLDDILPAVIELEEKLGFITFTETKEKSIALHLVSMGDGSQVSLELPYANSGTGGAPVQNLGGTVTYLRRYLYSVAFELSEGDSVDGNVADLSAKTTALQAKATQPKPQPKPQPKQEAKPIEVEIETKVESTMSMAQFQKTIIELLGTPQNASKYLSHKGYTNARDIPGDAYFDILKDAKVFADKLVARANA
ncbi:MAG: hypothetical protein ACOX2M_03990 [Fastidiosipilaceae bacterium]|jgi:hypothetical protein